MVHDGAVQYVSAYSLSQCTNVVHDGAVQYVAVQYEAGCLNRVSGCEGVRCGGAVDVVYTQRFATIRSKKHSTNMTINLEAF